LISQQQFAAMSIEGISVNASNWQKEAFQALIQENYSVMTTICQQAIEFELENKLPYWYLGLALLLQGEEAEAQATWMLAMVEGEEEQIEQWTAELDQVLQLEVERREALKDDSIAWMLRQHRREINPYNLTNLLQLVLLSIKLKQFQCEDLTALGIIELLKSNVQENVDVDADLLLRTLKETLDYAPLDPNLPEFAEACLPYVHKPQIFIYILMMAATEIAYAADRNGLAIRYAHLGLRLNPEDLEVLSHLTAFHQDAGQFEQGIAVAQQLYAASKTLPDQIFGSFFVLRSLMRTGGHWQEAIAAFQRHEELLTKLIKESPDSLDRTTISRLTNSTFPLPYIRDQASANRLVQNGLLQLCQANIQSYARALTDKYRQRAASRRVTTVTASKPLRIGYLSHCFRQHSVGWLSRWLFQYHDREQFKLYSYFVNYRSHVHDPLQDWFVENSDEARLLGREAEAIAEQVDQDEIDILIDLDSITADISCEAMAMKPAPIQVTWLGWDASGLPAIDYFIADPYVLPEAAESYYSEKIWRMPQTYIAVDGFEVGVPTLRRDQLNIPTDAVVYLSTQTGYKRHPDTVRLQMQILRAVPNSYFLIKGPADAESIKRFFTDVAEAEGVESDRLRFLPGVPAESVHRANLGIADVVLDTFPYNGATTTLETLWMGIPIVTRVGEQFASRNSYTMMMNAGITEGIAWTDEEYVEWGVRLGEDVALRQQISWKLWRSRQTAPLWNAKQFTREMESAYQQMWLKYIESK
jgi:predicted O-linked N-acetylglucosamine transferase (SPINDLY family)